MQDNSSKTKRTALSQDESIATSVFASKRRKTSEICDAILAQIREGITSKSALKTRLGLSGTGVNKYLASLVAENKIKASGKGYNVVESKPAEQVADQPTLESRTLALPQLVVLADGSTSFDEPKRPAISFEDVSACERVKILTSVKPVEKVEQVESDKVKHVIRKRIKHNRAAYDMTNPGALENIFYWLESPNLKAALRQSYRENKRIMHVDCLLCENGACFGIRHYYTLPLNAFVDGCKIIACQRRISLIKEATAKQETALNDLYLARKQAKSWHEARNIEAEANKIKAEIAPQRRKIYQLEDEIVTHSLEILPLELAINGILTSQEVENACIK